MQTGANTCINYGTAWHRGVIFHRTEDKFDSDRYYKTFKTYDHLVTMLYATLGGVSSLRELYTVLLACEGRIVSGRT